MAWILVRRFAFAVPVIAFSGMFAMVLGYVNARIILTVVFVLVLTPIGLVWRLIRRDPLARRREHWAGWVPHPGRYRNTAHYTKMY